jgi:pyruvate formate lyase activating enzyme
LELTNLIIPGQNDSDQHFENLFAWIADLNEAIPLHLSAYHPSFQFETPRTPTKTLLKAYDLAKKRLKYVYLGNIALAGYADTNCPLCQHQLVRRQGYRISVDGIEHGHCRHCQAKVDLVGV